MIMFKRIDHVEIVTDQPEKTERFYTDVLGFTVKARDRIERSGLGVPIDLVYLDLGGTVVELISYEGASVDPVPQNEHLGYRMIALEVDDREKAADYLRAKVSTSSGARRAKGVDIVWGPRVRETSQGQKSATRTATTSSSDNGSREPIPHPVRDHIREPRADPALPFGARLPFLTTRLRPQSIEDRYLRPAEGRAAE